MAKRNDPFIELGKIVKTKGLKGEVKVKSYTESPESIARYSELYLRGEGLEPRSFQIERVYPQKNILVLKLKNVDTIDQAAPLVGFHICVFKSALEQTDEDEYYWHELIGLRILDEAGNELGELKSILSTGAHDIFVIEGEGTELLLPAIDDFVVKIDVPNNVMVVKPPEFI